MPDTTTLVLFMGAALALLVVPGPAVLYIVARSIEGGTSAGLVSILGIHCGSLMHIAAASLGISSLLVSSALAFNVVKYLGAAYLVFLGVRTLFSRDEVDLGGPRAQARRRRIFGEGIVVNVLNPKTALFFFAFLPQFVDVERGHVGFQMLTLGLVFIALGLVSDGAWAVAAGATATRLRARAGFLRARRWLSGGVYLGLGLAAAFSGHRARATD